MTFAKRLKDLRTEKGFDQSSICEALNIEQSTLSNYENGRRTPKPETLVKMAALFNVSVDYLLGNEEQTKEVNAIPVLGTVQAGIPLEAIEDIIDYEEISPSLLEHGEEYFALQVKGDSMLPRMREGDVVIVRKQADVAHDDIAIVLVNGSEATIKRIVKSEAGIMLVANNPAYEPRFYSNKEIAELPVIILGKVVELRAKF